MILDVGQNRFAGAIDAAQVQAGVQVVGHDPAVRVLHILGQGVDVVQDAGNVGRNLVCGLGCPVGLTGCAVLQCIDGDVIAGGQNADDARLLVAVPNQVIHLDIVHPAGRFSTRRVQRLHNTQHRIAAAGTQFLHVVAVAVADVDNFRTMGSALHIDTGQVAGVVGDNISKANRLIAVVFDIRSSLIGFAGLREDLQAGQLREVLIVRLGLNMRQLLGEEDACIVGSIQTNLRAGERVLICLVNQGGTLAVQGKAVFLAVTVGGVERIVLSHIEPP